MIRKIKYIILTLFLTQLWSCKNNEVVEGYSDGKIKATYKLKESKIHGLYKQYYKNGNVKAEIYYKNGIKDSLSNTYFKEMNGVLKNTTYWKKNRAIYEKQYYYQGGLKSEGNLMQDSLRIGKWKLYNLDGYKSEIVEYFNIKNLSFLNQKWMINNHGDTISGGNYYKLKMKDTVKLNKPFRIHFFLKKPILSFNSQSYVLIPKENNLNKDFSNQDEIEWDTIENIALRYRNRKIYQDRNHDVIFDLNPNEKGMRSLKGILLERNKTVKDSFDFTTRKIYFDLPYYVKGKK